MPDLSVETCMPKINWENLHYCRFIRVALIIQVQNQEKSTYLISNMRFLASCIRYRDWFSVCTYRDLFIEAFL